MPSSRGVPPTPLNIRGSSETTHGRQDSFDSYYSDKDSKETPRSSKSLGNHSQPSPNHKSSKPHSPTVNVYTHCGRHTDQYLFGGWSNAFKNAFKKD
ncbi:hypothetical protein F4781DRAFT_373548 [Annulohypoxylon bovei var. microspora]|nr:hypothetical protein F4781DRAFT_373548 [Annulohypoxylon bovei var. microspora]